MGSPEHSQPIPKPDCGIPEDATEIQAGEVALWIWEQDRRADTARVVMMGDDGQGQMYGHMHVGKLFSGLETYRRRQMAQAMGATSP